MRISVRLRTLRLEFEGELFIAQRLVLEGLLAKEFLNAEFLFACRVFF